MYKLIITMINYEKEYQREFIPFRCYNTRKDAENAAKYMVYTRRNDDGIITHKCVVKIMRVDYE